MTVDKLKYFEITLLEGESNYTWIHHKDGHKQLSSYTLLRYEERLTDFIRVSRKYLVNPNAIIEVKLEHKRQFVMLDNGLVIPVPRRIRV